jgi:Ni,Fe-hydrogenase III large subunit
MPIRKKEVENEITESISDTEEASEQASDKENNNFATQAKDSVNKIKERFFSKFKRTTEEPSLEQRTTEISSTSDSSRDDVGTEERSAGVAVTTKDDIFVEDKISDWTISQPPSEPKIVEKVEYDSAGRIHKTHYVKQTTVDGKTIEEEVEDLQGNILKQ